MTEIRQMAERFRERVTIVTGGGSGLGRSMALRFAKEGAKVVVADVDGPRANEVADAIISEGGEALSQTTDVTNASDVKAMVAAVRNTFGPANILVNNAAKATDANFLSLTEEAWDADLATTLKGPFLCSQAVLEDMTKRGSGVILNISSVNALAYYGNEAYSAAKAGLLSLTRSLAVRYGPHGIRVNAIAPGTLKTQAWEKRIEKDPEVLDRVSKWYPLGRVGDPGDVVGAALFLASDEAAWISGAVLPIDGALTAGNLQMTQDIM